MLTLWVGLAALGCGPEVVDPQSGDGGGQARACELKDPILLSEGAGFEVSGATPWRGGNFFVYGGSFAEQALLDPCAGTVDAIQPETRLFAFVEGALLGCDRSTEALFLADPLGHPIGSPLGTAKGCYARAYDVGQEEVVLAISLDEKLQLFDEEGSHVLDLPPVTQAVSATLDATTRTGGPGIGSVGRDGEEQVLVVDDTKTMLLADPRTGTVTAIASAVEDFNTRGNRVFFRTAASSRIQVHDLKLRETWELPTDVLSHACMIDSEGDWLRLPVAEVGECDRTESREIVEVRSGRRYRLPDGHHISSHIDSGRFLVAGESMAWWTPETAAFQPLWTGTGAHPILIPTRTDLATTARLVYEERDGKESAVVVPLDGSPPWDLLGGHPVISIAYLDDTGVVAITDDFELVFYDGASGTMTTVATNVVDTDYPAMTEDFGHPPQLLFERSDPQGVWKDEHWLLPLPLQ